MKLFVLLSVIALSRAQWVADCGGSQYADAGENQDWTRHVVGGVVARDNEFPYQISMERFGSHSCGGNILNENYIITAAHCTDGSSAGSLTVVTERIRRTTGGVDYDVAEVINNNAYNAFTFDNDISLLRTSSPMALNERANGVCAPSAGNDYDNAFLTTSGWGTTSFGGSSSNDLLYANIVGLSNTECGGDYPGQITSAMICADSPFFRDACQGDSGGPLVFKNNGRFELVGLVSWGNGCATNAGVYTRVTEMLGWISSNAN